MRIKNLSFLLALVMILSAFAGTFVVNAEEEAAVNPWEVGGQTFATFNEAVAAAVAGDTIYLIADATESTDLVVQKDLTFEGRKKADGTNPVFTFAPTWQVIKIGEKEDASLACTVLFKNMDFATVGLRQSGVFYIYDGCSLTFDNVNVNYGVGTAGHYITKGLFRIYGSDVEVTLKECKVTCPEGSNTPINPSLVSFEKETYTNSMCTFDSCEIDFSMASAPFYVVQAGIEAAPNFTVVLRNSTIKTPDSVDYPFAQGDLPSNGTGTQFKNQTMFTGLIDYRGTNTVNGQTTVNADIDYLIYDAQARDQGYTIRVGEVKDAIILKEDGTAELIGYYKDLVEACNAAAATETSKQKEVFLIADVTVEDNLTLPSATIDGQNKTLTAPRIYKAPNAVLEVSNLKIKTTAAHPILQMNADVIPETPAAPDTPAEGEGEGETEEPEVYVPSYAKFVKCTFETDQAMPYAYFVLSADLTLDRCKIVINNAECDKPIFRLDNGADLTLAGTEINVAESAPNVLGFDVVSDLGSLITLKGNTTLALAQTAFTETSKDNVTLVVSERASVSSSEADAIVIPASATNWVFTLNGSATIAAPKGAALVVAAPNLAVSIGGNVKLTAAKTVLHAAAEGVTFTVASGVTLELANHAKNDAAVLLEGANSKLISNGTITTIGTRTKYASIRLSGAGTSALIKGGAITGTVQVGTTENTAAFVMTGGTVTAYDSADAAVVVNNGSANILSGTLSGGAKAIAGTKEVAYAEGETSIVLNELYLNAPVTVGVSMRMNDGSLGMRFTSSADAAATAYAKALKEAGAVADYEFGTLIVRATEIRSREMTVAALSADNVTHATVKAEAGIVTAEDGSITYTAAVINFTEDNMGTSLVARAYVKYTLIDGSALYVYAEDHTEGISIGELAQKALSDVSKEPAEGYRNLVESFYEADEDGWYELIEEAAYSPYSKAQQAALKTIIYNADL